MQGMQASNGEKRVQQHFFRRIKAGGSTGVVERRGKFRALRHLHTRDKALLHCDTSVDSCRTNTSGHSRKHLFPELTGRACARCQVSLDRRGGAAQPARQAARPAPRLGASNRGRALHPVRPLAAALLFPSFCCVLCPAGLSERAVADKFHVLSFCDPDLLRCSVEWDNPHGGVCDDTFELSEDGSQLVQGTNMVIRDTQLHVDYK